MIFFLNVMNASPANSCHLPRPGSSLHHSCLVPNNSNNLINAYFVFPVYRHLFSILFKVTQINPNSISCNRSFLNGTWIQNFLWTLIIKAEWHHTLIALSSACVLSPTGFTFFFGAFLHTVRANALV